MAVSLLIAALGGVAIGMERQRSGHATGPTSHFGGLRTFTLLGMVAGLAGVLSRNQFEWAGAVLLAAAGGLVVVGYFAASRVDIDATTEAAGLVVLGAGFLAGLGMWIFASGLIALTSLLLVEKSRLHELAERLPDAGLRAGFRFAVMALVILPLLPEGPYGPFGGVKPRELWVIVLLISGLSFAGYVARQLVGAGQGYVVTGILGGLVSSTNVTLTLSRTSKVEPASGTSLALGVIAACTVMYLRVAVVTAALNPELGVAFLPYWIAPALGGGAISLFGLRRKGQNADAGEFPHNPLEIGSALKMALLFQVVLFAISEVRDRLGEAGMLASGAVLGLTDVDALTISMSKSAVGPEQVATAAMAVAIGCLANSFFKLAIALTLGRGQFRPYVAVGFAVMIAAAGVAIAVKGYS